MLKVVVPVREEIVRAAERRKAAGMEADVAQSLAHLIEVGFEHQLHEVYRRFETGEISLGYAAQELGLGLRELYALLEERNLATSNIGGPTETAT
jgi:hypothetical protein